MSFLILAVYNTIQNQKFLSRRCRETYTETLKPILIFKKVNAFFRSLYFRGTGGMDLPGERDVWYFHQGSQMILGTTGLFPMRPRTSLSLNVSAGCNVFLETLVYNLGAQKKKSKENIFSSF